MTIQDLEVQDIMEKFEEIRCFKCGMPFGFIRDNNLKISHYGKQTYIINCDCGEKYYVRLNIYRLSPGEFKNDWKK